MHENLYDVDVIKKVCVKEIYIIKFMGAQEKDHSNNWLLLKLIDEKIIQKCSNI